MAGSDSNWGRIIMIGKTGVALNNSKISIKFGRFYIKIWANLLLKNVKKLITI